MTKKLNVLLIVVLLIGGLLLGAGAYYYISAKKRPAGVENFLASGAIFYGRLGNVEKNLNGFLASSFWKRISRIDWIKALEANKTDPQVIEQIKSSLAAITQVVENPMVKDFLGQEVAFVVYPIAQDQLINNPQVLLENFILTTKLNSQANVAESLAKMFLSNQKDGSVPVVTENYKGHTITRIRMQPIEICYAKIKDYLIVGLAPRYIYAAIDVIKNDQLALSRDPKFLQAQSIVKPADGLIIFDIESTLGPLKPYLQQMAAASNIPNVQEFFDRTDGFKMYVLSYLPGPPVHIQFRMTMNKNFMKAQIRKVYDVQASKNETLKFTPSTVAGYQWGNNYDVKQSWQELKNQIAQASRGQGDIQQAIAQLEAQLGLKIEDDLLPLIGEEIGGYFSSVNTSGMFPLPELSFFLKITDPLKVQNLLMSVIGKNPVILMQQEEYRKFNIHYFSIPVGVTVEPGYCFIDHYLILSTSRNLLKAAIDAKATGSNLASDAQFTSTDPGLADKNNAVFYIRGDLLARAMQSLVDWADKWAGNRVGQVEAFKAGAERRLLETKENLAAADGKYIQIQDSMQVLKAEGVQAESQIRTQMATSGIVNAPASEPAETVDAASLQNQLASLQQEATTLDKERSELRESELLHSKNIKIFEDQKKESDKLQIMLKEVATPLLQALETLTTFSARMNFRENAIEAEVYLKQQ